VHYPVLDNVQPQLQDGPYLWQDLNDDQTIQTNEVVKASGSAEGHLNWLGPDLTLWNEVGSLFQPLRVESERSPVIRFHAAVKTAFKGSNSNAGSFWLDEQDDSVYTLNPGEEPGLARWTRDGKLIWGYAGVLPWNQSVHLSLVTPGKTLGSDQTPRHSR